MCSASYPNVELWTGACLDSSACLFGLQVGGDLRGPQVGSEHFVPDAGRGNPFGEQGGADVPHERQRPAGERLEVVGGALPG